MAAKRKKPTRRRQSPPRKVAPRPPVLPREVHEQAAARWYTARWHRVAAWVDEALALAGYDDVGDGVTSRVHAGSYYGQVKDSARVERKAVSRVRDLTDEEEAYEFGLPLEYLGDFAEGPGRGEGGQRRVVITALTWTADDKREICYDPAWITLGHGLTARTAAAAAARWVEGYADAVARGLASRRLILTALEIKFWTAPRGTKYV